MLKRLINRGLLPLLGLALLLVSNLAVPMTSSAQSAERCFPETGYCISGPIRSYWENNGGLPVFGYPISEQFQDTVEGRTLQVQWFERDRLEIQANGNVTTGRLGAQQMALRGLNDDPPAKPTTAKNSTSCRFFPETGHNLCQPFLDYWEDNGGLERFGYPLTESYVNDTGMLVQYTERRRFEFHPYEAPGYQVLLGRLGAELRGYTP